MAMKAVDLNQEGKDGEVRTARKGYSEARKEMIG